MAKTFDTLTTIELKEDSSYFHPQDLPVIARITDPALDVMIDFTHMEPLTIDQNATIDAAQTEIAHSHNSYLHMLLVINADNHVVGLISNEDLMGERTVKFINERRIPRNEIPVKAVMTPRANIVTFNLADLLHSKVGNVTETLRHAKQHYALVVEVDTATKKHTVRGLFSTVQISRQLGSPTGEMAIAHSLAELKHDLDR